MATKHVLKLSAINTFHENENKIIRKGENALESGHVKQMVFDAELLTIRGQVSASMKNKDYKVEICLNKDGDIILANCSCPRGIKCHHIAALALFGHYNIAATDVECVWNIPKGKPDEVQTSDEMYPARPYSAIDRHISNEELSDLKQKLSSLGSTVGFTWLLQEESGEADINVTIPLMEDILFSEEYHRSENKETYLREKCQVDDATITKVAELTIGQSQNEKWILVRKYRLTASNFGLVLDAQKRGRFPPSLFKRLSGVYNLEGVKAIQWGRLHEKVAIEHFKNTMDLEVQETGIWLTNSGLLGASPDGLVQDDAIIEVKCPYSYRSDVLSETLKSTSSYIIHFNEEGDVVVNNTHHYYHQIQGLLHILNRSICYLCIWTTKEAIIAPIERDDSWASNVEILENFVTQQYVPSLM